MFRISMVLALGLLVAAAALFAGCPPTRYDVLWVSKTSYDFEYSEIPWYFEVANGNPSIMPTVWFEITTNRDWLICSPASGTSTSRQDTKLIEVRVDRGKLPEAGRYYGTITIGGANLVLKTIYIDVTSEGTSGEGTGGWSISEVTPHYSAPYLLEFSFSLRDENGSAVLAEPADFEVTCMEDAVPISNETEAHIAKATNKQLMAYLVLDYTLSMYQANAIADMENAAKYVFLDSLDADAQVGIYEFHRNEVGYPPEKVADFTTDKEYLRGRIDAIEEEYVRGFPAASRCWDALYSAAEEFDPEVTGDEQRVIVVLSDGSDESSTNSAQDVIDIARARDIAIYGIGFGADEQQDEDGNAIPNMLQLITESTDGAYYPADQANELATQFEQIINDLGGRYVLRWATLKTSNTSFVPSFEITLADNDGDHTFKYEADSHEYLPSRYAGDPLAGTLRMVVSQGSDTTAAVLRAIYVPRYITQLSLSATTQYTIQDVSLVAAADGGLCDGWDLQVVNQTPGEVGVFLQSSEPPHDIFDAIPYAAFGPIVRFDFAELAEDAAALFDEEPVIDNEIYAAGQSFTFESWPPELPEKTAGR